MDDLEDYCKHIADFFRIVESHDEWCEGSELCRECFIATLREAKKTADRSGRKLCVVASSIGYDEKVDVYYVSGEGLNREDRIFRRERQCTARLMQTFGLHPNDPLKLKVREEIRARAKVYGRRVN